jgi:hypothetical protein
MPSNVNDHGGGTVRIAEDQFKEIIDMLRPMHTFATVMLAEHIEANRPSISPPRPGPDYDGQADLPEAGHWPKSFGEKNPLAEAEHD